MQPPRNGGFFIAHNIIEKNNIVHIIIKQIIKLCH